MNRAIPSILLGVCLLASALSTEEALSYGSAYQQQRLEIERQRVEALREDDQAELAELDRKRRQLLLQLGQGPRPEIRMPETLLPSGSTSGLKIPGVTSR